MPATTDARVIGVVKSVTPRGYGFIRLPYNDDGTKPNDVFMHAAECNNRYDEMKAGTKVEFGIGEDEKGRMEAKNVKII